MQTTPRCSRRLSSRRSLESSCRHTSIPTIYIYTVCSSGGTCADGWRRPRTASRSSQSQCQSQCQRRKVLSQPHPPPSTPSPPLFTIGCPPPRVASRVSTAGRRTRRCSVPVPGIVHRGGRRIGVAATAYVATGCAACCHRRAGGEGGAGGSRGIGDPGPRDPRYMWRGGGSSS